MINRDAFHRACLLAHSRAMREAPRTKAQVTAFHARLTSFVTRATEEQLQNCKRVMAEARSQGGPEPHTRALRVLETYLRS